MGDGPFVRTVRVRITDKDGDSGTGSTSVTVANVAPAVTIDVRAQDNGAERTHQESHAEGRKGQH